MSEFLNKVVGRYTGGRQFVARRFVTPKFQRAEKLYQDIVQSRMGIILFTDKGDFWGPPIEHVSPNLLAFHPERILRTAQITFNHGFEIRNVLAVDLENQFLVKPKGMEVPVTVEAGDVLAIDLAFEFFNRDYRPCKH